MIKRKGIPKKTQYIKRATLPSDHTKGCSMKTNRDKRVSIRHSMMDMIRATTFKGDEAEGQLRRKMTTPGVK